MKSGNELMDAFTQWIERGVKVKEGQHGMELIPEQLERKPFLLYEGNTWKIGKEGANRGFDAVYSAVNSKKGVEINIPVEFKSNSDIFDKRLSEQIHRHISVFGISCVVIDDHEGVNLLSLPKKFFNFIPAFVFVKKGMDFIKVSEGIKDCKLPGFYVSNIHELLPYGLKASAVPLSLILEDLDSIMRKLYMERMRTALSGADHEVIPFTDSELAVMECLLVKASVDGTITSFQEAIKVLEKLKRWQYDKKDNGVMVGDSSPD